jgi:four helix bundle protein
MAKRYQDIEAWQLAMTLAQRVYAATSRMPQDERFGLTMQIRRAAVSVPSNIAEGFGRYSRVEFRRFQRVARGLLFEVQTQFELACRLGMLKQEDSSGLVEELAQTDRVLQAFIRGLEDSAVPAG